MSIKHHSRFFPADDKYSEAKRMRRAMTHAEALLWSKLRGNRLEGLHFRRQHVLHGFIMDFYCRRLGIIVEVDGEIHKQREEGDRIRDSVSSHTDSASFDSQMETWKEISSR